MFRLSRLLLRRCCIRTNQRRNRRGHSQFRHPANLSATLSGGDGPHGTLPLARSEPGNPGDVVMMSDFGAAHPAEELFRAVRVDA